MLQRLLAGLGGLMLSYSSVDAQTLNIDHQPVGCVVAERFPRLEARLSPADTVAVARVLFHPENAQHWYAVVMKSEGPGFSGVLPKPKKSLKAFRYYIEVTGKALGSSRTADYTTNVVASPGECKGKLVAAALASASVLLQVPAGAAALPAGFASTGVVAAGSGAAGAASGTAVGGGGLSTGALVGIVAGAGAAAAGVVVAAGKGGDEGSSATSKSYSGPFNGQLVFTETTGTVTCSHTRVLSGSMTITLEVSGGAVTGSARMNGTNTNSGVTGPACTPPENRPFNYGGPVTGTTGNLVFGVETVATGQVTSTVTIAFQGALSNDVIAGTVSYSNRTQGTGSGGSPIVGSGSTTFSVTLR